MRPTAMYMITSLNFLSEKTIRIVAFCGIIALIPFLVLEGIGLWHDSEWIILDYRSNDSQRFYFEHAILFVLITLALIIYIAVLYRNIKGLFVLPFMFWTCFIWLRFVFLKSTLNDSLNRMLLCVPVIFALLAVFLMIRTQWHGRRDGIVPRFPGSGYCERKAFCNMGVVINWLFFCALMVFMSLLYFLTIFDHASGVYIYQQDNIVIVNFLVGLREESLYRLIPFVSVFWIYNLLKRLLPLDKAWILKMYLVFSSIVILYIQYKFGQAHLLKDPALREILIGQAGITNIEMFYYVFNQGVMGVFFSLSFLIVFLQQRGVWKWFPLFPFLTSVLVHAFLNVLISLNPTIRY